MRSVEKWLPGQIIEKDHEVSSEYSSRLDAKEVLLKNLGNYCCYCERKMSNSNLHLEHVRPKSLNPYESAQWENFLLSCLTCNSQKKAQVVDLDALLFPHLHNTYACFKGNLGIKPEIRDGLSIEFKTRAENTLALLRLDRSTETNPKPTRGDDRQKERADASTEINRFLLAYDNGKYVLEDVIRQALIIGYWSIWMDAFAAYPAVQDALIAAFPGTYPDCRKGQIARP